MLALVPFIYALATLVLLELPLVLELSDPAVPVLPTAPAPPDPELEESPAALLELPACAPLLEGGVDDTAPALDDDDELETGLMLTELPLPLVVPPLFGSSVSLGVTTFAWPPKSHAVEAFFCAT